MMQPNLHTIKPNRHLPINPRLLQDLLGIMDDIQEAAMFGDLDDEGHETLNMLGDIHSTLEEAILELERRLGLHRWDD